ncbi:hypothetical protein NDR87_27640 [Nocardia sp. CDC159]|uniref:Uncharacterized protein n=1 Tax=Nocardia pulmonis TaxID=2951408 RepID=A0A9X2J0Q2_9NOCA|nr:MULTISPECIES: hypothetical protein [Nocardia]MCM6777265.1 hypothetical protein [Nocardia pulmonis]MCM6790150.1 hypothetical protein [Nocardia sp. CDC159]
MSAGELVSRNAKTVISAVGGLINVLAATALLFHYAPAELAGFGAAALTALEVLRSVNVWLVKNEPLIEAAVDAGAELIEAIQHPRGAA